MHHGIAAREEISIRNREHLDGTSRMKRLNNHGAAEFLHVAGSIDDDPRGVRAHTGLWTGAEVGGKIGGIDRIANPQEMEVSGRSFFPASVAVAGANVGPAPLTRYSSTW